MGKKRNEPKPDHKINKGLELDQQIIDLVKNHLPVGLQEIFKFMCHTDPENEVLNELVVTAKLFRHTHAHEVVQSDEKKREFIIEHGRFKSYTSNNQFPNHTTLSFLGPRPKNCSWCGQLL